MKKNRFNFLSNIPYHKLFIAYALLLMPCAASAITIRQAGGVGGNAGRSYAGAYNQVAAMQNMGAVEQQQVQAAQTVTLPVTVADADLANAIKSGDESAGVTKDDLDECAMIYPGGSFAWDVSNIGGKTVRTCVANIELRKINKNQKVGDLYTGDKPDIILATARAAAGSSFKCNIAAFPESGLLDDAGKVVFPADAEPTVDDVIKVMDAEQKKNAAMKIAASTVVGGLVGNVFGAPAPGHGGLLGTGSDKMKSTAIGALGGAALMYTSTQAGKVAGDTILSAGVNMTFGAMIGNMMATGDAKVKVENCILTDGEPPNQTRTPMKCVWGMVREQKTLDSQNLVGFFNWIKNSTKVCEKGDGKPPFKKCRDQEIIDFGIPAPYYTVAKGAKESYDQYRMLPQDQTFYLNKPATGGVPEMTNSSGDDKDKWVKVTGGGIPTMTLPAAVPFPGEKFFGISADEFKSKFQETDPVFSRGANGEISKHSNTTLFVFKNFEPINESASDGDIIDLDNKARMKSTMIGGVVGGGLGALAGYQGAQKDIEDRWISAVQEYKDSLPIFYCATGTRFLAQYNDIAIIPALRVATPAAQ